MSLGSSNMAGTALGMASSLLLYASIIQGLQDVATARYETREAAVGQNITLRCILKRDPGLKIAHIEWSKSRNINTKLALYHPVHGTHYFWHNVTLEANVTNDSISSYLHLREVTKWDGGIYICDIATFPHGSIRRETELKIKDPLRVNCDVDGAVDVREGENVTIHCSATEIAEFTWSKDKSLVSQNESLKLWWVTAAQAGVYTLTVKTGSESSHKEFVITVQTATTTLRTDVTPPPQSYVSKEDVSGPADGSLTTPAPTGLSTADTSVARTVSVRTVVTGDGLNPGRERVTSFPNHTRVGVSSSPTAHTDSHRSLDSATLSSASTDETRNESTLHTVRPDGISPPRPEESSTLGNITEKYESPGATATTLSAGGGRAGDDTVQSPLAVLIILPILVLIAVAGYLYRRHVIKQRLDLPPPFKPPPPPVRYTAARHCETSTQHFPIAKCNSVAGPTDMKQMYYV